MIRPRGSKGVKLNKCWSDTGGKQEAALIRRQLNTGVTHVGAGEARRQTGHRWLLMEMAILEVEHWVGCDEKRRWRVCVGIVSHWEDKGGPSRIWTGIHRSPHHFQSGRNNGVRTSTIRSYSYIQMHICLHVCPMYVAWCKFKVRTGSQKNRKS